MVVSLVLLGVSLVLTYLAMGYTNNHIGSVVTDILLDNLPVYDVSFMFFQGAFIFVLVLSAILAFEPKYIPFTLEASALFFVTRSFFMIMTHLAPPSVAYYNYVGYEEKVREVLFTATSGNDLFFSGHAGYPFLLGLVFWNVLPLRYFFFACSAAGSIAVILGHLHYSIDVFAAFFIAFGIFEAAKRFFKKEYHLLNS